MGQNQGMAKQEDGPFAEYYDCGELRAKGTYKDFERCGEWIEDGETVTEPLQ